jgi:hypothetical protein
VSGGDAPVSPRRWHISLGAQPWLVIGAGTRAAQCVQGTGVRQLTFRWAERRGSIAGAEQASVEERSVLSREEGPKQVKHCYDSKKSHNRGSELQRGRVARIVIVMSVEAVHSPVPASKTPWHSCDDSVPLQSRLRGTGFLPAGLAQDRATDSVRAKTRGLRGLGFIPWRVGEQEATSCS